MTRRTTGPKRRAEHYAGATARLINSIGATIDRTDLARAWMAGYQSAARKRRIARPKPRK
jgi:hypothetical protein